MRETNRSTLSARRILVVEDEYMIADDLQRELEGLGAQVVGPVARVSEALRLLRTEGTLDGAVLDINLAGDMAYPAADLLVERRIPFLFMTGYDDDAIPDRFAGVPTFQKPIDAGDIAVAISAVFQAG